MKKLLLATIMATLAINVHPTSNSSRSWGILGAGCWVYSALSFAEAWKDHKLLQKTRTEKTNLKGALTPGSAADPEARKKSSEKLEKIDAKPKKWANRRNAALAGATLSFTLGGVFFYLSHRLK